MTLRRGNGNGTGKNKDHRKARRELPPGAKLHPPPACLPNRPRLEAPENPYGLSAQEWLFVTEYPVDFDAKAAAKRCGFKELHGRVLLQKPNIRAALTEKFKERAEKNDLTINRIIEEISRVCFVDPRNMFDESGNLIPIVDMDEDTARAISQVHVGRDTVNVRNGIEGEQTSVTAFSTVNIKMHNKLDALKLLGQHLGAFKGDAVPSGTVNNQVNILNLGKLSRDELENLRELCTKASYASAASDS